MASKKAQLTRRKKKGPAEARERDIIDLTSPAKSPNKIKYRMTEERPETQESRDTLQSMELTSTSEQTKSPTKKRKSKSVEEERETSLIIPETPSPVKRRKWDDDIGLRETSIIPETPSPQAISESPKKKTVKE